MRREKFVQGLGCPHIFLPSVGEIWTCYGEEWLLHKEDREGFATIAVSGHATLTCNKLEHFTKDRPYKYVRTATLEEINEIVKRKQKHDNEEIFLAT